MRGIVLAGGTGSRLWPITQAVSKHLLPIFDKPLIYYPISTLMAAGIREILVITTLNDQPNFEKLLGDGSDFGITISYATQTSPRGLVDAFIVGKQFIKNDKVALILGDNLFHGIGLGRQLARHLEVEGAQIFAYRVANPTSYGVIELNADNRAISLEEKPEFPKSNLAVTGLYFFDESVCELAETVEPGKRGELEIVDLLKLYLQVGRLSTSVLNRGVTWLDTGTPGNMHDASSYVKIVEERQGIKIGCLEEIALNQKWISRADLEYRLQLFGLQNSEYGRYLRQFIAE